MDRRHSFVNLDHLQLSELLRPAFPGAVLEAAEPVSGGRCNTNYKVRLRSDPSAYFLRLYSRGRDVACKEAALHARLKNVVPVPELLYLDAVGHASGGVPYAVFEWLAYPPLDTVLPGIAEAGAAALGASAGETLGAIASVAFDTPGDLGPELAVVPWPDSGDGAFVEFMRSRLMQGRVRRRLGERTADAVLRVVDRESYRLRDEDAAARLVHSDFNPSNMLVDISRGAPRIGAVVDWEFAHAGTPLVDVGNMLREHRALPARFTAAFTEAAHAALGPLPEDWLFRSRLLDLSAHVEFLDSEDERPEMHATARATIERMMAEESYE